MNRVKKISKLYGMAKPEIDQLRAIRSHTRRARKAAAKTSLLHQQIEQVREALQQKNVKDLKEMARDLAIDGRSKMKKDELVEAIVRA